MVDQEPRFTFTKRGVFYFSRRVPSTLIDEFGTSRIVVSLRTRSASQARKSALALAAKLEAAWALMRVEQLVPKLKAERVVGRPKQRLRSSETSARLSDAHALYCRLKGAGKGATFRAYTDRNMGYAIDCLGDVAIDSLGRADSSRFRDALIERGLTTSSIKRVFATVRSATNLAISERGLNCPNPFSGTFIPIVGEKRVRQPIPDDVLLSVQRTCLSLDDEKRLLIALISDTGLRLAEAVGLIRSDINVETEIPFLEVRIHPWRTLKTPSSVRTVPLIGASLVAARRLVAKRQSRFIFPGYASADGSNANSASAALNQWLRPRLPKGCVIHSFRHSLRDRLRATECPADIVDAIGGWTTQGVGHGYGKGYPLAVKHRWLKAIESDGFKREENACPPES